MIVRGEKNIAEFVASEFMRNYSREERRAMSVQEAYVAGAMRMNRATRWPHRVRRTRAYLLGLKRGYRLGCSA